MAIFTTSKAISESCNLVSDGILQLGTSDASLLPIVSFYPSQTGPDSKTLNFQSNTRSIEDLALNFGPLVLIFMLVVLVVALWRLSLKRSGINAQTLPANRKGQTSDLMSIAAQRGFPDLKFDFNHATLFGLHHSSLFASCTQLTAPNGAAYDNFGISVSLSGDYAIIGSLNEVGGIAHQGSAYVYFRSSSEWNEQAKLTASDGAAYDYFGWSVSIDGNYALIGADEDDIGVDFNQGSAYVFLRNGTDWSQQAKLTASDGTSFDYFGYCVSLSGNYALIGAYLDDVGSNSDQGSAYIFLVNGTSWSQQAQLTDGTAYSRFAFSVSLSGDYALIGCPYFNVGGNNDQGYFFIYLRNGTTWSLQVQLTAFDGEAGDKFGYSVSVHGNYAVVGAYHDDYNGMDSCGSAYAYHRNETVWNMEAHLVASDGTSGD